MVVKEKHSFLTKRLAIGSLIAGLLFIIANTAVWININVFNTENFTQTTVTSIASESSRNALGDRITERALQNNPVLNNIAGDQISGIMSGLLGTDFVHSLLTDSAKKLQIYVTSKDQQDVDIDLSGIKSTLTRVVEVTGSNDTARIDPDNIPEQIVLIEADNVPDLYNYGVILTWLAPLAVIGAAAALAWPYIGDRKNYASIMAFQGAVVAVAGLFALLAGPLIRPSVLEPFRNTNGRAVVGNLYDAFIATYNSQTLVLVWVGLLVFVVGIAIKLYPALRTALRSNVKAKQ